MPYKIKEPVVNKGPILALKLMGVFFVFCVCVCVCEKDQNNMCSSLCSACGLISTISLYIPLDANV